MLPVTFFYITETDLKSTEQNVKILTNLRAQIIFLLFREFVSTTQYKGKLTYFKVHNWQDSRANAQDKYLTCSLK